MPNKEILNKIESVIKMHKDLWDSEIKAFTVKKEDQEKNNVKYNVYLKKSDLKEKVSDLVNTYNKLYELYKFDKENLFYLTETLFMFVDLHEPYNNTICGLIDKYYPKSVNSLDILNDSYMSFYILNEMLSNLEDKLSDKIVDKIK
jgi:DNA repair ATPase RecN